MRNFSKVDRNFGTLKGKEENRKKEKKERVKQ